MYAVAYKKTGHETNVLKEYENSTHIAGLLA